MKILVYGVVQGVGFRPAVYRLAVEKNLNGYVHNKGSCVEICIDGDPDDFMDDLIKSLPPLARVERYEVFPGEPEWEGFRIIKSEDGVRSSHIPPDVAICDECLREIFSPGKRRYMYPFTNCVNCGARFSVIETVPYDRKNTSMADFPMCRDCEKEYSTPGNRRFHAQTISCPVCGPRYEVYVRSDESGNRAGSGGLEKVETDDPIGFFAKKIDTGAIGVMHSWGGSHVVCSVERTPLLRRLYNRPQKPFAVMVKDLAVAERVAEIGEVERVLLQSPQAPIVLVKKRRGGDLTPEDGWVEDVAPGLDRVGLYLPYSAAQHIFFHKLRGTEAVVMTSGNLPGSPMATTPEEMFRLPGEVYLVHNRRIINRVDDSVVIPRPSFTSPESGDGGVFFIRKSRGYIPDPIVLKHQIAINGGVVVGFGGDMNNTSALHHEGRVYTTQHIGDMENYDVQHFAASSLERMFKYLGKTGRDVERVVVDMHPRYHSRRLGLKKAEEWSSDGGNAVEVLEIQHHAAHAYSLVCDAGLDPHQPFVALSWDGTGYGSDGSVWGGEIIALEGARYERVGSLTPFPLVGGDSAVKHPSRVLYSILVEGGLVDTQTWTAEILGVAERDFIEKAVRKRNFVWTSSMGRFLDALSAYLGVCGEMTYDGEPAMKLERYIARGLEIAGKGDLGGLSGGSGGAGGHVRGMEVDVVNDGGIKRVDVYGVFSNLLDAFKPPFSEKDRALAAWMAVDAVVEKMVDVAVEKARALGVDVVGFTGGVSYNLAIQQMVHEKCARHGIKVVTHRRVPNGDGGISVGQVMYGLLR